MKNRFILSFLFLCFLISDAYSQQYSEYLTLSGYTMQTQYNTLNRNRALVINDNSIYAHEVREIGNTQSDVLILVVDPGGSVTNDIVYGQSSRDETPEFVMETNDGFLVVGTSRDGALDAFIFVAEFDNMGNLMWSRNYVVAGKTVMRGIGAVQVNNSGDFLILGRDDDLLTTMVLRISSQGNLIWVNDYIRNGLNQSANEIVYSQNTDTYLVVGQEATLPPAVSDVLFLFEMEDNGSVVGHYFYQYEIPHTPPSFENHYLNPTLLSVNDGFLLHFSSDINDQNSTISGLEMYPTLMSLDDSYNAQWAQIYDFGQNYHFCYQMGAKVLNAEEVGLYKKCEYFGLPAPEAGYIKVNSANGLPILGKRYIESSSLGITYIPPGGAMSAPNSGELSMSVMLENRIKLMKVDLDGNTSDCVITPEVKGKKLQATTNVDVISESNLQGAALNYQLLDYQVFFQQLACFEEPTGFIKPTNNTFVEAETGLEVNRSENNSIINFDFQLEEDQDITVFHYNILGQLISTKNLGKQSGDIQIPISKSELTTGVNLISIQVGKDLHSFKVIKN